MTEDQEQQGHSGGQPEGASHSELRSIKLAKLAALREGGRDPYRHVRWDRTHNCGVIAPDFEQLEGSTVVLAGRVMSKRDMGKAAFLDIQDESGRVQLYFKKDKLDEAQGEGSFDAAMQLDLGDILGVRGTVFRTRTGQASVEVQAYELLCKTLETLPEKWHGLTDTEQRFRQRYVDMIVNRESLARLTQRSRAVAEVRRFLDQRDFLEVETPVLHAVCGGATAEPFVTHWNALKADYYLRIALELHLKRLIVGGMERVYEIGRVFRNEGVSTRHNPEFTMLELYWAYVDYSDIMQLTEDLVVHLADNVFQAREVTYGDYALKLEAPFAKMTFNEALGRYAGCTLADLTTLEQVRAQGERLGLHMPREAGYEKSLDEIFKEKVEPHLIQPTFIYDYPKGLSPLAKSMPRDIAREKGYPDEVEICYRFELFLACMEVANSFSELNDPIDQRARMEAQVADKAEGIAEVDEDFLTALEYGMPPTGGLGVGIDRLVMVLSGTPSIREVLAFPQLRDKK
ncbi:lysine--tRNA ligase [bacterium]|nr:lysine--tRNA ligase [bacterium]